MRHFLLLNSTEAALKVWQNWVCAFLYVVFLQDRDEVSIPEIGKSNHSPAQGMQQAAQAKKDELYINLTMSWTEEQAWKKSSF